MKKAKRVLITSLFWMAGTWVFADEPIELTGQKQILHVLKATEGADYSDPTSSLKAYRTAHEKLADLRVSDANREQLLQARAVVAVLAQQWDDFESLSKELRQQDRWDLHIKTWRMQMRVARKEWETLANDVTEFAKELSRQPLNLADINQPTSKAAYSLLRLRIAISWQTDEALPPEFQTIVDEVAPLKATYDDAFKGEPTGYYPASPFAYSWLSEYLRFPESKSLTKNQLAAMIANQENAVREAEARSKKATRDYADWQASLGMKPGLTDAEERHFKEKSDLGKEKTKRSLLKELERTTDDPLGVALRSGLWAWQREQLQDTRSVKNGLQSHLERIVRQSGR